MRSPGASPLDPALAGVAVFVSSAAVLVIEILAGRMMAPYVGVSITTYTTAIGAVLAGIAVGAWAGGRLADHADRPERMLPGAVLLGAAAALLTVPAVRLLGGATAGQPVALRTLLLGGAVFMPPAALLSTVTPVTAKVLLRSTDTTGSLVGWLSALGTAGALAGTFLTGFVFVAAWPVPATVVGVAVVLLLLGAVLAAATRPRRRRVAQAAAAVLVAGALAAVTAEQCDRYTTYYCARVVEEGSTRRLVLDDLTHTAVDLAEPDTLVLPYTQVIGAVIDTLPRGPVDAVHVGAGGLAVPRWLAATRPGSTGTVLEIDDVLVDLTLARLGGPVPGTAVRIGDARLTIADLPTDSADVVVGDAFASRSVPWHLTTAEFLAEVERVLRPDGLYVMNVIDGRGARFTRAEVATLQAVFGAVVVAPGAGERLASVDGNVILVAGSPQAVDGAALAAAVAPLGVSLAHGPSVDAFAAGAPVLTDDYAPVDQWVDHR